MQVQDKWTLAAVLQATGGSLIGTRLDPGSETMAFSGISIDSRTIQPDELFVAIRGEIHDGHRFADAVVEKGGRGLILCQSALSGLPVARWQQMPVACVVVADTTQALGALAAYHRRRSRAAVIAITGSNGKTSTRAMTAAIFARVASTLATQGNFNNEIGLPLTLLRLNPDHRWAITELGMNHHGEIARLAAICAPDIGAITNVAPAHLEGVGSLEGVMQAKGELVTALTEGQTAVLNQDDPMVRRIAASARCRVVRFGRSKEAQVRAAAIHQDPRGIFFQLQLPDKNIPVHLNTAGTFMVSNALAAAAVANSAGLPADTIAEGLAAFTPQKGRLKIRNIAGIQIIDDTYNANPASVAAALETLKVLAAGRRAFAVLGDMLELGQQASPLHKTVGKLAADTSLVGLCTVGQYAHTMANAAMRAGMPSQAILTGSHETIAAHLIRELRPGDWLLVKGSRGMRMERVVQELRQKMIP